MTTANEHETDLAFTVLEEYFQVNKEHTQLTIVDTIDQEAKRQRAIEKFRFLVEMKKFDLAHQPKKKWFPWKITVERR